jgi:hypothetical protein
MHYLMGEVMSWVKVMMMIMLTMKVTEILRLWNKYPQTVLVFLEDILQICANIYSRESLVVGKEREISGQEMQGLKKRDETH